MCLGVPMQIATVTGIAGHMTDGTLADLSLTPDAGPGDWVLVFLGAAREVLTPESAAQISAALDGLRSLMAGGGLGDAFADLDNRTPTLPPHLQAALDAGQPTG